MLKRAEKEEIVKGLKADIERSQGIFLTNLIGVGANDAVQVRRNVRNAKGKLIVARNTLFKRAAKGTPSEKLFEGLKGPSAVAFAFEDAAAVAKSLKDSSKELELVTLRGGMLNGEVLNKAQVEQLANLPSRDQMLATLLATFNAPISAFARVLNEIKNQKEQQSGAVQA